MIFILYSTQTGNARNYAQRIKSTLQYKVNLRSILIDISNFQSLENWTIEWQQHLSKDLQDVVFLVVASTYGNGGSPTQSQSFETFLNRNTKKLCSEIALKLDRKIYFTVLALGDKCYTEFCGFGKYIDNCFAEDNSDSRLYKVCLLDNDSSKTEQEETFLSWRERVYEKLVTLRLKQSKSPPVQTIFKAIKKPKEGIVLDNFVHTEAIKASIVESIFLTDDVLKLTLAFESDFKFNPVDTLNIYPWNQNSICNEIVDELFCSYKNSLLSYKENLFTLPQIFEQYFDLNSLPTTDFLERLKILSPKASFDFKEKYPKTIAEALLSLNIFDKNKNLSDINYWNTLLPQIKPRQYTICNLTSKTSHEKQVKAEICLKIVKNINKTEVWGLCSQHLNRLHEDKKSDKIPTVYVTPVKSSFRLFDFKKSYFVLVSSGTGITVSIAILRKLAQLSISEKKESEVFLYYGFRTKDDIIFSKEIEKMNSINGLKINKIAALSKETYKRIYVQRKMKENKQILKSILPKSSISIAGNSNMIQGVKAAIRQICGRNSFSDMETANQIVIEPFY